MYLTYETKEMKDKKKQFIPTYSNDLEIILNSVHVIFRFMLLLLDVISTLLTNKWHRINSALLPTEYRLEIRRRVPFTWWPDSRERREWKEKNSNLIGLFQSEILDAQKLSNDDDDDETKERRRDGRESNMH